VTGAPIALSAFNESLSGGACNGRTEMRVNEPGVVALGSTSKV
jgi:hypothetical protein